MPLLFSIILSVFSLAISGQKSDKPKTFPSSWKSIGDIQKKWIMLERDSLGYVVYNPCDGGTPRIYIDSGYVTIYWQLDGPSKLSIDKFTRLRGNQAFYMNATNESGTIDFTVEIKDAKRKLVLWTFGGMKWVMTPVEQAKYFRQVNNPCRDEKKPEKQFLGVEF